MQTSGDLSLGSLLFSSILLLIPIVISYKEDLGLEKDIVVAGVRAAVQLFIIGYILQFIFNVNHSWVTILMILFMVVNASWNAAKRSKGIPDAFQIALISIAFGAIITLVILLVTGAINWTPREVIPIMGMLSSNAMTGLSLSFNDMNDKFTDQKQKVLEKISLGANPSQASKIVVRESIKTGLIPQIDSTKMVGLVSLPGMMTGMIMAGAEPTAAIRYQLVIMFMMLSSVGLSTIIGAYLAYPKFFNDEGQLVTE
ncbi:iron export ABC transporter permease subunit FetB [Suicoccus acidiformans]|uniref:Iron export ABC transporter permease subunit FetB n=1 Tax=Suicoccus acidiformans TaxID=2036206 RepID=A0A347WJW0_9LACT|nr:iron export ABC transporter permease subunit FetB [Suicoccus acidiformans]AXY25367.1 iron export ABC transporter permease subunit FetB [Suicoccus acidiformans]